MMVDSKRSSASFLWTPLHNDCCSLQISSHILGPGLITKKSTRKPCEMPIALKHFDEKAAPHRTAFPVISKRLATGPTLSIWSGSPQLPTGARPDGSRFMYISQLYRHQAINSCRRKVQRRVGGLQPVTLGVEILTSAVETPRHSRDGHRNSASIWVGDAQQSGYESF